MLNCGHIVPVSYYADFSPVIACCEFGPQNVCNISFFFGHGSRILNELN